MRSLPSEAVPEAGLATALADVAALPGGTWPSPITAVDAAAPHAPQTRYAGVAVTDDGRSVWWAHTRPDQAGRMSILRRIGDGPAQEMLPPQLDARTSVHEYGGLAWTAVADTLVTSNFSDQRLYRVDGDTSTPITPDTAGADRYAEPTALPGDTWVACVRERHGEKVSHALVAVPLDGSGDIVELWTDSDFVVAPTVSPDGRRIAFLSWDHPSMPWDGSELQVAPLSWTQDRPTLGPAVVALGGPEEAVLAPTWSDGETVCAATDRSGWWNLVAIPAVGGTPESLWSVERDCGVPLWRLGLRSHISLTGGRTAVVCAGRLHLLDTASEPTAIATPFTSWLPWLAADGDILVGVAAAADRRPAVVRVDTRSGQWTVLDEPDQPDTTWAPTPTLMDIPTDDGRSVAAAFYPPTSPITRLPDGAAPPGVMFVHGGPTAAFARHYQDDVSFFTSRGLAVVAVDYTGSSGRGRRHRTALWGRWGVVDVDDCIVVARVLLAAGRVSGLVIRGMSAGGLTALSALSRTGQPFAAGVSYYGVADLEDQAERTHEFESRYHDRLIGPWPAARELYRQRSPLARMATVTHPVLLLQGLRDPVVPAAQTRAVAAELARREVPHALLTFPDEGHTFSDRDAIATSLQAELSFYGQVFGFEPPGVPSLRLTPDRATALGEP
ncbi:MAG: hypothetical protein DLM59_11240 [Pseudonocardiales bacterium]|nr:MAG: hypothetical protein DLM59_11240 [Pseudonocardiales bacterium]